jgi:ubiquinone/menaquinone biosynthesis C-methylase UbiE
MIEIARVLTPEASFLVGRGESIPLPDASVDAAFSTISFHHWGDQAAGIREVARVLRPGGLFCLADGTIPAAAAGLVPHTRLHTRREMAQLFREGRLPVAAQKPLFGGAVFVTVGKKP